MDEQITALSSSGYDVGITHEGADSAFRCVDEAGRETILRARAVVGVERGAAFRDAREAAMVRTIEGLLRVVEELHDRLEMTEAYVASATAARQDMADIPGLGDDPPRGEPDDQCRNCGSWGWKIHVYTSPVNGCCYDCNRRFLAAEGPK